MDQKLSRKEFMIWMLKSTGYAFSLPYVLELNQAFSATGSHQYFIGIMAHTLALSKTVNDTSGLHNNFFTGYGNWTFNGYGSLSGLDSIKSNIFVPRGLTYRMQEGTEAVGHFQAQGGFLTGYPSRGSSDYDMLVGDNNTSSAPNGTKSIDWLIAQSAGKTPLAAGYSKKAAFNGAEAPHFFNAISWRDPNNAYYPTFDSGALFQQLATLARCSTYNQDPSALQSLIDKTKAKITLMARVQNSYAQYFKLNKRYAEPYELYMNDFSAETEKLKTDLTNLQSGLEYQNTKPAICDWSGPTIKGESPSISDIPTYEKKVQELNQMVTLALKANLTNAATMSLCLQVNHGYEHYISKNDIGRDGVTEQTIINHGNGLRDYMNSLSKNIVHLVNQLKAAGIFEKTLILVGGEQNDGNTHTATEAPVFIIDGSNSSWNGRNVGPTVSGQTAPEDKPYASLLVDILKKFGITKSTFGSPKNVKGVGTGGIF